MTNVSFRIYVVLNCWTESAHVEETLPCGRSGHEKSFSCFVGQRDKKVRLGRTGLDKCRRPCGRTAGSVWIAATVTRAFHGVPFITAISFLSAGVWMQCVAVMQSCHRRSALRARLCLSTLIDEHTGVKLDWFPPLVRSRPAPTHAPFVQISGLGYRKMRGHQIISIK